MLQKKLDCLNRTMFACQIKRYVIVVAEWIDSSRSLQQHRNTIQMSMNDSMYERGEIVVIDQVDGGSIGWNMSALQDKSLIICSQSRTADAMSSRPCIQA